MPNYEYTCIHCDTDEDRNVPIDYRDLQKCDKCGNRLNRVWSFNGAVWSPTSSKGASHK